MEEIVDFFRVFATHFVQTFVFCTTGAVIGSILGISYIIMSSIIEDDDILKETKIVFRVVYQIATNLHRVANDLSTRIGAWLLITDKEFQETFNKIAYEEKYNKQFDALLASHIPDTTTRKIITPQSIVFEHTPIGNIVMHYDPDDRRLIYYSNRSLTTRQLQSVGRKFVIQFCCPHIMQEMITEKEEKKETPGETKKETQRGGIASRSGLMAKFKQSDNDKKNTTQTENKDNTKTEPEPTNYADMFRFIKKGGLTDFSFTQKPTTSSYCDYAKTDKQENNDLNNKQTTYTNAHIDKSKLSFSEYKNIMKMKQENNTEQQPEP